MNYQPTPVPIGAAPTLRAWLSQQFHDIANSLRAPQAEVLQLDILSAEPAKYTNGAIVYADGATWNPGSGAGFYGREAGAWVKL